MYKSITRVIRQIPLAARLRETWARLARNRAEVSLLKQLANAPHPRGEQIAAALSTMRSKLAPPEQDWVDRIEEQRDRLLHRDELLIDGTLGKGGLYDEGRTIRKVCLASKPIRPARLLFALTRATNPSRVIELGTNVGISSAYIAAALTLNGNGGTLTTLDASPYRQRVAKEVHSNLGIDNVTYIHGLFASTLSPTAATLEAIDLAFIDGHHQYQPTLDYLNALLGFSTANTVFVFDDIRWSDGMKKAWAQIQADDRLGLVVDLSSVGIGACRREETERRFVSDRINPFE